MGIHTFKINDRRAAKGWGSIPIRLTILRLKDGDPYLQD